ncbi:glycosyltransferase family 2 protein [Paragemmobacter straminiformis]|uniref:Glycosyltransferase n=1 Tax=Paragemmobacter straminiformis TaxID=2045119 RepID=A0A842I5A2_9RHOB|nr:glycosyltransferase [Gemmobacter straminiformis]MBC2835030.1 glycosyltransferase [Gemmobacter straminiformis]
MTPWLSVAMPLHNGASLLPATLESAARERPEGVEFILFDSSPDPGPTCRIAESYSGRLALRWVATPEIVSWTAKTNRAVTEARAPHVCMLHQDDLWLPGHLASVRDAMGRAPDASLSVGPSQFIDDAGRAIGAWNLPFATGSQTPDTVLSALIVQNSIAIPSPVIRRDHWIACGGLDDALWYTADWDLYLKIARQGPFFIREKATTAFRLHGASLTVKGAKDAAAFRDQLERVLARHLPHLPAAQARRDTRLARASVEVNCFLAAALHKAERHPLRLVAMLLGLGPAGLARYLHRSRLVDRALPRLRLKRLGGI